LIKAGEVYLLFEKSTQKLLKGVKGIFSLRVLGQRPKHFVILSGFVMAFYPYGR
jgi:hypothetical protein